MPPNPRPSVLLRRALLACVMIASAGCSSGGDDVAEADQGAGATTGPTASTGPVSTTGAPAPPPAPIVPAPPTTLPPPVCVVTVAPGDSVSAIAARNGITLTEFQAENLIDPTDTIHPGQKFDVCIGNDPDDITGASRLAPPPEAVVRQQSELNELFSNYSLLPLVVDGDSGRYTRQAICAARLGLGLPVHNGHLATGSEEEAAIFAATELGIPAGAPTDADRWILVDQTCQVIVTGERDERIVGVFPTSTGEAGHETFNVRARAFRYDPATDNDGWHDSTSFPVEVDNPLNGNMYKPIYFNDGQAIHGAQFIPPQPRSKGCARTFPLHQDMILDWLGLDDMTEATWNVRDIGVTVVVQGRYTDPTAD